MGINSNLLPGRARLENGDSFLVDTAAGTGRLSIGAAQNQFTRNQHLEDNWYFPDPIIQRNISGTITTVGYFIDRWKLLSGSVTLTGSGLVLNGTMAQILENAPAGAVNASALTTSGLDTSAASYDTSTKTFTLTGNGQTFTAVKLELGDQQTLAHQDASGNWVLNDPPPNKALELLKCQRYYTKGVLPVLNSNAVSNYFVCYERFPTTMRATPAITIKAIKSNGVEKLNALKSAYNGEFIEGVELAAHAVDERGLYLVRYTGTLPAELFADFNYEASADL